MILGSVEQTSSTASAQRNSLVTKVIRAGRLVEVYQCSRSWDPWMDFVIPTRGDRMNKVRREDSALRAKRMVRWISAANSEIGQTYFWTATFADDVQDYDEGYRRWKKFIRLITAEFSTLRYVAVPEVQPRSGRWHFHALFAGLPTVEALRAKYGKMVARNGAIVDAWQYHFTQVWSHANGGEQTHRASIELAQSLEGVCAYLSKYLVKDVGGSVPVGRRNYYAGGKGLKRPVLLQGPEHVPAGAPSFERVYKNHRGQDVFFCRYVV